MANRSIGVTLGVVAIVALGLTGVMYSTGQLGGWLKSGLDAASTREIGRAHV